MQTYEDFQSEVSSEKLTLAVIHPSKRLMGWTLHTGSIYKLVNFDIASIVSLKDSGTAYTEVSSISACTASKFYNDRENQTLYLRTTGSDNPNGRFLALTFKLFFANLPVRLPHDLDSGFDVYWEPLIKSTSKFGVEIDIVNQTSEAIEGAGTLTMINDFSFWPANFDRLSFENKDVFIYSHHRDLDPTEAKLLFRGKIDKKTYNGPKVEFALKDLMSELKAAVGLATLENLGARIPDDLLLAKQRMVLGRVLGHRPVNIDQQATGYPLTGTISISHASPAVTGSGTAFLSEISPDDTIILSGTKFTVADVTTNTALTLTESYQGTSLSGASVDYLSDQPRRNKNRTWQIAGHALRQPSVLVEAGSTISSLILTNTNDMYAGDKCYLGPLGSGELVTIESVVSGKMITLTQTLGGIPSVGTAFIKPAVQNVRIDETELLFWRDYTVDAAAGELILRSSAESNASPIKQLANNLSFTNGSRTVTGTALTASIKPGYMVSCVGQSAYFEVMAVDSDTSMRLTVNASFTSAAAKGLVKPLIFNEGVTVLTCEVLGRTVDGTTGGELIATAPAAVKALLEDAGLSSLINDASFETAESIAYQQIGMVIPEKFNSTATLTYKELIDKINKSVFGSLVQTEAFELSYLVLRPNKSATSLRLKESDILKINASSSAEKAIKTSIVTYAPREYDYLTKNNSVRTAQKTSDNATYLLEIDRTKTFATYLVTEVDAQTYANRWALLLESNAGTITIETKLQAATLEVGDIIDIEHRKLFQRSGPGGTRRLALVESIKKSGNGVSIQAADLNNVFNRIAGITETTATWAQSTEEDRLYGGFISDDYGLIDNDQDSFGTNLIW